MAGDRPQLLSRDRLRLFCARSVRAYLAGLAAWVAISAAVAWIVCVLVTDPLSFLGYLVLALVAGMGGIGIMFVSSLINLRKQRPGFERLARGERDVEIAPVGARS